MTGHEAYEAYLAVRRARLAVDLAKRATDAFSDDEFVAGKVAEAVEAVHAAEKVATDIYYEVAQAESEAVPA
jgi:hypothetical protein